MSVLLGLLLLAFGGVIGSGVTALVIVRSVHNRLHHPDQFPAHAAARLRRTLDLSPQQTAAVETILRNRQAAIQDLRREFQPKVETEIDKLRDEITGQLTPAQAARWNRWLADKRRTWLPPVPPATATRSAHPRTR